MKRFLIFISLHLLLFILVFAYQAKAEEYEWDVQEFDTFITTSKHGEITYGDKLRFFINKGDCSRMGILFSFSTMKDNKNLQNLQNQTLPIKINGHTIHDGAKVVLVQPLFGHMNIVLMQSPGLKSIEKMINSLMNWYNQDNFFRIELVGKQGFDPNDYFDITNNNWKLDGLLDNITKAQSMCYGPEVIEIS
tara:strand:- start:421 stop:996 length:576 start_codon:yes stop_codon:yes gene_type:complete